VKNPIRSAVRAAYSLAMPRSVRSTLRLWLTDCWPDRRPTEITEFTADPVMILAPHMDDEAIGCGGTARRHVLAGATVTVIFMTDGRFGGYDPDNTLVQRRKDESRRAAEIIGFQELIFLDAPDLSLQPTMPVVERLAGAIEERKPRVIYLPAVTDAHVDHWNTNRCLAAALAKVPRNKHPDLIRGYEVWAPLPANRLVDIASVKDVKKQAINVFESQTRIDDYAAGILGLNQYRSMLYHHGKGCCEAFLETTPDEFARLCELALARHATRAAATPPVG
jgi:LmbE family N-acetylglucosaminyl deacetylase